jgi:hypothetical protein
VVCAVAAPGHSACAAPLNSTEVYAFLWEYNLAQKQCDADWLEPRYLPTAKLTFEIHGQLPQSVGPAEYFASFRKNCYHTEQTFEQSRVSVKVDGYQATVKGRWEGASLVRYFFLDSYSFDSIEETMILARVGEGIAVESVRQFLVPSGTQDGEVTTSEAGKTLGFDTVADEIRKGIYRPEN